MRPLALILAALPLVAQTLTPDQWRADLAVLATELPARHINAFAHIEKKQFEKNVQDLDRQIPQLSEPQIRAGFLRIIASLRDGHTGIWSEGRLPPFHRLPIGFYWFKDGIFVVSAAEEYRDLVGGKLDHIGRLSVAGATHAMEPLFAHENEAELRLRLPPMLATAELLSAAGVTESPDSARVEVIKDGRRVSMDVKPTDTGQQRNIVRAFAGTEPLYRKSSSRNYWAATIDEGATVYFQYNRCLEDTKQPFDDFRAKLKEMLSQEGVQRLIVDLRYNQGGDSKILDPWIADVKQGPFNAKGKLYVIVGRPTYSSGILNALSFRNETAAILVGEPTSGRPNHFGEVRTFDLPNSQMRIGYSTKFHRSAKEDTDSLIPDIIAEPSFQEYATGTDPVLKAIPR